MGRWPSAGVEAAKFKGAACGVSRKVTVREIWHGPPGGLTRPSRRPAGPAAETPRRAEFSELRPIAKAGPSSHLLQHRLRVQRAFGTFFVLEHQVQIASGGQHFLRSRRDTRDIVRRVP